MKLVRGCQPLYDFPSGVAATLGNFDGVHLGHQHLLKQLQLEAIARKLPTAVILFEPQPREYFQKEQAPARLSSLREKLDVLRSLQIDFVFCIKFNQELAQTSALDFAKKYLFSGLNIRYLLIGEDFRFGNNREGDFHLLKQLGVIKACKVDVFRDFCLQNERISSTQIRQDLASGDFKKVARDLGRLYSLCGRVIHGFARGRQWGIPTANLSLHRLTTPLRGVFAVKVRLGNASYYGVANVGKRPTVDGHKIILEVHLFDFHLSIYGQLMQVFFLHKLRDEVKFTSVEALISQIKEDILVAKAWVNRNVVSSDGRI